MVNAITKTQMGSRNNTRPTPMVSYFFHIFCLPSFFLSLLRSTLKKKNAVLFPPTSFRLYFRNIPLLVLPFCNKLETIVFGFIHTRVFLIVLLLRDSISLNASSLICRSSSSSE